MRYVFILLWWKMGRERKSRLNAGWSGFNMPGVKMCVRHYTYVNLQLLAGAGSVSGASDFAPGKNAEKYKHDCLVMGNRGVVGKLTLFSFLLSKRRRDWCHQTTKITLIRDFWWVVARWRCCLMEWTANEENSKILLNHDDITLLSCSLVLLLFVCFCH